MFDTWTGEDLEALCRADPESREATPQEVAFAQVERITLTDRAQAIGAANQITAHFPQVLAALGRGEITLAKVKILLEQTLNLIPEHRSAVADQMLQYGATKTPGQFRALVRKAVMSIDPDALKRRARKAVEDRGVWLRELADGMAVSRVFTSGGHVCRQLNLRSA